MSFYFKLYPFNLWEKSIVELKYQWNKFNFELNDEIKPKNWFWASGFYLFLHIHV